MSETRRSLYSNSNYVRNILVQKYQSIGWILIKHTIVRLIYVNTSHSITCFTLHNYGFEEEILRCVISMENIYIFSPERKRDRLARRDGMTILRHRLTILELRHLESVSCNHACNRGCVYLSLLEIRPTYVTFVTGRFLSFRSEMHVSYFDDSRYYFRGYPEHSETSPLIRC